MEGAAPSKVPPAFRTDRLDSKMQVRADVSAEQAAEQAADWPEEIFAILKRFEVRQVPYVPDAGHSQLINRVLGEPSMRGIPLTTEEEGIALMVGAWAGGGSG